MMKKLTIVNRPVLHILHSNITHLAISKRKTTNKNENLNWGEWKTSPKTGSKIH